ncbi:MAG: cold shock domain-containing protein [Terracidiphilus sp.]
MLKRAFRDKRKADSGTQYALTDASLEYLARFAAPSAGTLEKVQAALKKLRSLADQAQAKEMLYPYDIFAVRAATPDERICAVYLSSALKKARAGEIEEARQDIEHSKNLLPSSSEAYRISAIVEGKGLDLFKAAEEIRIAIDLNPRSSLAHYQYALFLLNQMEDYNPALAQIEAALQIDVGDPTLETARGLILTRLGRCEEGAATYEQILADLAAQPRRWRVSTLDQAAECYRRWAEKDRISRDPSQQMAHLERATAILDLALASNDFDIRTGAAYTNIVEDAIFGCIAVHDTTAIPRWLSRLEDAGHVVECPPFRILSVERLAEDLPDEEGLVEAIGESTKTSRVRWRQGFAPAVALPTRSEPKPKKHGVIKKIFTEQKFGFITDSEGKDWFFHFTHLLYPKQWESLAEGGKVAFAVGANRTGECAAEVRQV